MSRITIVLASLLKPVNDTRMFEKLGLSMSQTNKYDINIIGFSAKKNKKYPNIRFYPIFKFKRRSFARIIAPVLYFRILLKVKPKIIIVNSHDLLIITVIYKIFSGSKLIYDIQENYFRNIVFNDVFPERIKYAIGWYVRFKERLCLLLTDHCFIAENGYLKEMPYLKKKRHTILLNKYKEMSFNQNSKRHSPEKLTILFSGTLSDNYGIFNCIDFIEHLHQYDNRINLLITGYCAFAPAYSKLKDRIRSKPYIKLVGGDRLVPHEEIIGAVFSSDFGIINYKINPSTENCFPTKLYEYTACGLPVLVQHYDPWANFIIKHNAGIKVDFIHCDYEALIKKMLSMQFYLHGIPEESFWKSEEYKLLHALQDL